MMSSFCLCYIASTESVSGSVEGMNLIMIDITSYLLFFLLELFTYIILLKEMLISFCHDTYFVLNSASKKVTCC